LITAHRLSTIQGADTIHVLEKGSLVESGNWSELVDRENGRFNALGKAQGISRINELCDPATHLWCLTKQQNGYT
jgi:ABC-type transport system involved in cytochrome bd biosynthesis fused ATPase/permease subunit